MALTFSVKALKLIQMSLPMKRVDLASFWPQIDLNSVFKDAFTLYLCLHLNSLKVH
jgi:hypothetical protein